MGLIIAKFKKNGITFENAYAKIDKISVDNNAKIASFSIAIYSSKEDKNLISKLDGMWLKPDESALLPQCYARISEITEAKLARITALTAEIEFEFDENEKIRKEAMLSTMQNDEILQLDGGVIDEGIAPAGE